MDGSLVAVDGDARVRGAQGLNSVRDFLTRQGTQLPPRDYTVAFTRLVRESSGRST